MEEDKHLANDKVLNTLMFDNQTHLLILFTEDRLENKICLNLDKEVQISAIFLNKKTKQVILMTYTLDQQLIYESSLQIKISMRKVKSVEDCLKWKSNTETH